MIRSGAGPFSEGLANVTTGDKSGFIDKTGKLLFLVPPTHDGYPLRYCWHFSNGLAVVAFGQRDENGTPVELGYLDKRGHFAIPVRFGAANDFSEGLALVFPLGGGTPGYIDASGRFVIRRRFGPGSDFHEGLACITVKKKKDFIDKTGRVVIKPKFFVEGDFHCQRALVSYNGQYGYIDPKGALCIANPKIRPGV